MVEGRGVERLTFVFRREAAVEHCGDPGVVHCSEYVDEDDFLTAVAMSP